MGSWGASPISDGRQQGTSILWPLSWAWRKANKFWQVITAVTIYNSEGCQQDLSLYAHLNVIGLRAHHKSDGHYIVFCISLLFEEKTICFHCLPLTSNSCQYIREPYQLSPLPFWNGLNPSQLKSTYPNHAHGFPFTTIVLDLLNLWPPPWLMLMKPICTFQVGSTIRRGAITSQCDWLWFFLYK